jgi:hypothetical protein
MAGARGLLRWCNALELFDVDEEIRLRRQGTRRLRPPHGNVRGAVVALHGYELVDRRAHSARALRGFRVDDLPLRWPAAVVPMPCVPPAMRGALPPRPDGVPHVPRTRLPVTARRSCRALAVEVSEYSETSRLGRPCLTIAETAPNALADVRAAERRSRRCVVRVVDGGQVHEADWVRFVESTLSGLRGDHRHVNRGRKRRRRP